MADTYTPNLNLTKPEVGASRDTWGGKTNGDWDIVDAIFAAAGSGTSVGLNVGSGKTLTVAGTQNVTGTFKTDTVSEYTAAAGVTVDGVLLKDSGAVLGAGAVGTPSVTTTGDTNTGLYFPAADTLAATTGGTERLRIDSSGNVGIGTSSPTNKLSVSGSMNASNYYMQDSSAAAAGNYGFANSNGPSIQTWGNSSVNVGALLISTSGSERLRIDSAGNVGIGTSSPTNKLSVSGSMNASNYYMQDSSAAAAGNYGFANSNGPSIQTWGNSSAQAGALLFATSGTERARITSGGTLLVGTTTELNGITLKHAGGATTYRPSNNASFGIHHFNSDVGSTAALKSYVQGDGTYTNLSDQRFKTDITPARSYLGDLLKIQVVNYKWKDDDSAEKKLGIIAQQVEQIFPSMVKNVVGNSQTGETQKMVPHEVFVPMLITAIQELKAENDDLKARLTALEAK